MTRSRIAYLPLATFPEAVPDEAVRAAAAFPGPLGCALDLTTFAVELPRMSSGLGDVLIDVPALVRAAVAKSRAQCERLQNLVRGCVASSVDLHCATRKVRWSAVPQAAAEEARYFDLCLLPWSSDNEPARELAQAVIFGSGRPCLLVPSASSASVRDIAIAWDGSRVAARALGDVLPFLEAQARISILTIRDEKHVDGTLLARTLTASLARRGFQVAPIEATLGGRTISEALQETALSNGAQLLVMGGFGHSRIRDFVLGGATRGILDQLRLPVLLSH